MFIDESALFECHSHAHHLYFPEHFLALTLGWVDWEAQDNFTQFPPLDRFKHMITRLAGKHACHCITLASKFLPFPDNSNNYWVPITSILLVHYKPPFILLLLSYTSFHTTVSKLIHLCL